MADDQRTHVRPYWHVDMKWIFGIISVLLLIPALFASSLYQLTSQEAVERMALGVVEAIPAEEGVLGWYLEQVEQVAVKHPDEELELPILGTKLPLKGKALENLSREELREAIVSQLTRQLYQRGFLETFALKAPQGEEKDAFLRSVGFFGQATHRALGLVAVVLFLGAGVFAILMMLFSVQFGKAMSLGLALAMGCLPGFLALTFLEVGTRAGASGQRPGAAQAVIEALSGNIAPVARVYRGGFVAGMGLIILGAGASLALSLWRQRDSRAQS